MSHSDTPPPVTEVFRAIQAGDRQALNDLFPLLYRELYTLACAQRRRWHGDLTLNATALVNEAYIKLANQTGMVLESRSHFFALAAKAMRHVLCNYARDRGREKRGGGVEHVSIDRLLNSIPIDDPERLSDLCALDDALQQLEKLNERQCKVVECRFFAGMSVDDTAAALGIAASTVKRDWTMARAWLFREMRGNHA